MKEKKKSILLIVICALLMVYLLADAVLTLVNTKDRMTVNAVIGTELLTVEHSIGGIIPIGKDHYSLVLEADSNRVYVIHAPKHWIGENFAADCYPVSGDTVTASGLKKRVPDFQTAQELQGYVLELEDVECPLGTEYCLDLTAKPCAFLKLGLVAAVAVLAAVGVNMFRRKDSLNPRLFLIYMIAAAVVLFLLLRTLQ